MKALLLISLVVLVPAAEAAVTASATASSAAMTEPVTLTYTKMAGYWDGAQRGNVTPILMGAANLTLAPQSYNFTCPLLLASKSATLTWTWTPSHSGNYTVVFIDHAQQGTPATTTLQVHVSASDTQPGGGDGQVIASSGPPWGLVVDGLLVVAALVVAFGGRNSQRLVRWSMAAALLLVAIIVYWRW